jgi:hypothetical protein
LNKIDFSLTVETDGDAEHLRDVILEYLTLPEHPFLSDYGRPYSWGGYDGPFIRKVRVQSGIVYRKWEDPHPDRFVPDEDFEEVS